MSAFALITIDIDPTIELGPVTIAWHGLGIVLGLIAGGWLARRYACERSLREEEILNLVAVIAVAGMIGARAFYLLEHDALQRPGEWLGTNGYSFYGAIIAGVPAVGLYLRWRQLGLSYLDALAAGFPLGTAVGRIGDVINGEHYGPPSDLPWAVINAHPDADVPSHTVAYHSGGLYEVALGLAMLAVLWPLRGRFRRPGLLLCTVIGTYATARFGMFFLRSDSETVLAGLDSAQLTSAILVLAVIAAAALLSRTPRPMSCAEDAATAPARLK